MKPRTKLQHQVYSLSKNVPDINSNQKQWAFKNCLKHIGYRTKYNVSCLDCGNIWEGSQKVKTLACPGCGTKLSIQDTKKKLLTQSNIIIAIVDVVYGFQVLRYFDLSSAHKSGEKSRVNIREIVQQWFKPDEDVTIVGRVQYMGNQSYSGDMEIRGSSTGYRGTQYFVWADFIYPKATCLPVYKRNGFTPKVTDIGLYSLFYKLLHDNITETLIKAKQFDLLSNRIGSRSDKVYEFWDSIKVCIRHGYKVKESITWLDYMELLSHFKKDLRNPKYVCPTNLKQVHDKLVAKRNKIRAAEAAARAIQDEQRRIVENERIKIEDQKRRERVDLDQTAYAEKYGKFFGLVISDNALTIKVLEHVREFMQEGDLHGHCVFTNEYYKRDKSLILSAQVNGRSVETIEVSLSNWKIEQARGKNNKSSIYHDQIIDLVNKSMGIIKRRMKPDRAKRRVNQLMGAVA